jgi:large subunit ribosomal protein L30
MPRKSGVSSGEEVVAQRKKPPAKRSRAKALSHRRDGTPSSGTEGKLRVTQIRSGIGHAGTFRRTLRALGLKHHQDSVLVRDSPSVRGMIKKVEHLVKVEAVEE